MSIWRMPTVKAETGHRSHASIYNAIHAGLFTKPVPIGQRSVGWPSDEVQAINAARIAGKTESEIRELVQRLHVKRSELAIIQRGQAMTKEKATSPEKKAALEAIRAQFTGTDGGTQRAVLLKALETVPSVSTYEARRDLDIYYPPSRIKELRNEGYQIETYRQLVTTEAGVDHSVGVYVLIKGGANAQA